MTALVGLGGLDELHALARQAVREVPGLVSAEFFTSAGLDILVAHAGLVPPLVRPAQAYLLLEASGPGALDNLADVIGERDAAVGESAADRARLWSYRERHPEAAGFLGVPIKLDVSVERALFARIRSALDPSATLNPNVLPRLPGRSGNGCHETRRSSRAQGVGLRASRAAPRARRRVRPGSSVGPGRPAGTVSPSSAAGLDRHSWATATWPAPPGQRSSGTGSPPG